MPVYTVEDTETNKKITFEWNGKKPPADADMMEVFASARKQGLEPQQPSMLSDTVTTLKNLGRVYPAAEVAATMFSSIYGYPVSGLAGLFALPFGLEKAKDVVEKVQKGLIHQPQTEHGAELTRGATYPVQKLDQAGGYVGGKLEEAGHPMLGAAAHSAIVGVPVIAGARSILKPSPTKRVSKLDIEISKAIDKGIKKATRPSVVGKEMYSQTKKYHSQARLAVKEIVKNKDQLTLIDESGVKIQGLPKTLDQFSQAIEQTKRTIFKEYDSLANHANIKINLKPIAKELKVVINSNVMRSLSPETIKYAQLRIKKLNKYGKFTATETQEAIQLLNQTLEYFYRKPSPRLKGEAFVDALIANNLRLQLHKNIMKTTGKNYQLLKNKYGALRAIEKDVTKRSIVDARKNVKGLIDFSDIYSSYHIIRGMLAKEPSTAIAGGVARTVKHYLKLRNDPNRIVKNMFEDVESLMSKQNVARYRGR